jgi:GT2 family glycosyltransferase
MNYSPQFSVIIPTYHRNDLLAKCLDCVSPEVQLLSTDRYEVIVTDDGRDTTAEEMIHDKYPWAKWVAGPSKGPAANRNNGASHAQGEWLVFTDDDCLPDPQWLTSYSEAIAQNINCSVFEGRTYVDRPRRTLAEQSPVNESGGYLWSCNFAIRKESFKKLKGFEERFPYAAMEDVDFRLRLEQLSYKFIFISEASICHPYRLSGGWRELKRYEHSTLIYLLLHPEESSRINSLYYLNFTIRKFIRGTIPDLLKFKGRGIGQVYLEHIVLLKMAYVLSSKLITDVTLANFQSELGSKK